MWTSPAEREHFWRNLMFTYERRLRSYAMRTRAHPDDVEEIIRETWAIAIDQESNLRLSPNPWSELHQIIEVV